MCSAHTKNQIAKLLYSMLFLPCCFAESNRIRHIGPNHQFSRYRCTLIQIYAVEFWVHIGNVTTAADKRRYTPGEIVMKVLTKYPKQFKGSAKVKLPQCEQYLRQARVRKHAHIGYPDLVSPIDFG